MSDSGSSSENAASKNDKEIQLEKDKRDIEIFTTMNNKLIDAMNIAPPGFFMKILEDENHPLFGMTMLISEQHYKLCKLIGQRNCQNSIIEEKFEDDEAIIKFRSMTDEQRFKFILE